MSLFEQFKQNMESLNKRELDQFWEEINALPQEGPSAVELVERWGYHLEKCPPPRPKISLNQVMQEALNISEPYFL